MKEMLRLEMLEPNTIMFTKYKNAIVDAAALNEKGEFQSISSPTGESLSASRWVVSVHRYHAEKAGAPLSDKTNISGPKHIVLFHKGQETLLFEFSKLLKKDVAFCAKDKTRTSQELNRLDLNSSEQRESLSDSDEDDDDQRIELDSHSHSDDVSSSEPIDIVPRRKKPALSSRPTAEEKEHASAAYSESESLESSLSSVDTDDFDSALEAASKRSTQAALSRAMQQQQQKDVSSSDEHASSNARAMSPPPPPPPPHPSPIESIDVSIDKQISEAYENGMFEAVRMAIEQAEMDVRASRALDKERVQSLKRKNTELADQNQSMQAELDKLRKTVETLAAQSSKRDEDKNRAMQSYLTAKQASEQHKQELEKLREENQQLQAKRQKVELASAAEARQLRKENERIAEQQQHESEKQLSVLEEQRAALEEQLAQSNAALQQKDADVHELQKNSAELRENFVSLATQFEELTKKYEEARWRSQTENHALGQLLNDPFQGFPESSSQQDMLQMRPEDVPFPMPIPT